MRECVTKLAAEPPKGSRRGKQWLSPSAEALGPGGGACLNIMKALNDCYRQGMAVMWAQSTKNLDPVRPRI